MFRLLGDAGLLGLPFGEDVGGGGQPYEVYLQVVEELAARWASVALGVSVHTLSCFPIDRFGTEAQRRDLLPDMVGGGLLGAYCLSEAHAGSDPAAMRASAQDQRRRLAGQRREGLGHPRRARRLLLDVPAHPGRRRDAASPASTSRPDLPGFSAARPEEKMGLTGSTTAAIRLDDVPVPADRLVGERGRGLSIALAALDSGRLGVSAVAVGLAQSALDVAVRLRRRAARRSAGRSSSTRASPSCWPTWPPRSSRRAPPTWSPPAARTPASPTRARPASPSWWPPTPR